MKQFEDDNLNYTILQLLEEVEEQIDLIYRHIQHGMERQGLDGLESIFTKIGLLIEAINKSPSLESNIVDFNSALSLVEQALISKDSFLMSDYLEYEVLPLLRSIKVKLSV